MKFVLFVTLIWSILDSGWSITDEEYIQFKAGLAQIQVLTSEVQDLRNDNQDLRNENQAGQKQIQVLITEVSELKAENKEMRKENKQFHLRVDNLEEKCGVESDLDLAQNTTIEERVIILEAQMTEVQEDLVTVDEDIDFLFDEQVIQDERLFSLEEETEGLEERVEVLEANGGGGGNVTALEVRVETLEGTASEHEADIADLESVTSNLDGRVETLEGETSELETRMTAAETLIEDLNSTTSILDSRVETLEGETSELETRLNTAETLIEGLLQTDIELDSRITDLEEGGGGNETIIAFQVVMDEFNLTPGSTLVFGDVRLNEGNGYDPDTGVFTVPAGGEGYYYLATHITTDAYVLITIELRVNNVAVCSLREDTEDVLDTDNAGCSATVFLEEGDEVTNVYSSGGDTTPLLTTAYSGCTGFRI